MEKEPQFDYELKSKQIRQYRTNDINSVRRAVCVNVQEYLVHQGLEEDHPLSLKKLSVSLLLILFGSGSFLVQFTEYSHIQIRFVLAILFAILMGLSFLNSYAQKSSNVFFKSSGRVKETAQSKKYISLLKGKQLRILYYTNSFSYTVKLEAQIVDKPRLFRAQQVLASASKEVQFSKYFSAHGFFYPPALKEDMDSLLLSVASKK